MRVLTAIWQLLVKVFSKPEASSSVTYQPVAGDRRLAAVGRLIWAAQDVVDRWEEGDLAEAVRELDAATKEVLWSARLDCPIIRLGDGPLSVDDLSDMEGSGRIRAVVEVDIDDLLGFSHVGLQRELADCITGSERGLVAIMFDVYPLDIPTANTVAFEVTAEALAWDAIHDIASLHLALP